MPAHADVIHPASEGREHSVRAPRGRAKETIAAPGGCRERNEGTFYTFRLEIKDGKSRCGVNQGGTWTYTTYEPIYAGKMYYKTGNYTQPPTSTSSAATKTEVRVKDISISH